MVNTLKWLAKDEGATNRKVTLGRSVTARRAVRVDITQLSTYILGLPNTGKSNLLARLFLENQDHSKILIDPQGKLTNELILPNIDDPARIIYFAPYEQRQRPLAFNPFDFGKTPTQDERDELAGSLRSIFAHLWLESYGKYPNMEMVIQNSLNLLVQFEGMTFLDMARLLIDKKFRLDLARRIEDQNLRDFWQKHYRNDMGISTYNKLNEFIQIGAVRRSICQRRASFYLNEAMDQGKTIIVNLGGLPENATSVLGALFVSRVLIELHRREPIPTDKLTPFAVFVDEFDLFGSQAFETIISKCRQQKSSVVIAHQHWGQLNRRMQQAVIQAAYVVCFKVDSLTAKGIEGEFNHQADLVNVPHHHAWVRLVKQKTGAEPVVDLIKTKKAPEGDPERVQAIKQMVGRFGRPAKEAEVDIAANYGVINRYRRGEVSSLEEPVQEEVHETPTQISTQGAKAIPGYGADWPARFRYRPSVVFIGLGKGKGDQ